MKINICNDSDFLNFTDEIVGSIEVDEGKVDDKLKEENNLSDENKFECKESASFIIRK